MKIILIAGIPGVGKSTIVEKVIELLEKDEIKVKLINVGDILFEIAKKEFSISQKSEIRKCLSINKHHYLQQKLIKTINRLKRIGIDVVILDTHIFIKKENDVYLPGWPLSILRDLNIDGVIIIKAPITDIIQRRKKGEKIRDVESESLLKIHQNLTIMGAIAVSILTGSPIALVDNPEGNVEEVVKRIVKAIKKYIYEGC